jgi:predicted RNase H-like HicB family nuclease
MEDRTYVVHATWDDEAKVWVAESEDVPGLVTEAKDLNALMDKLRVMVPELLELNGCLPKDHSPDVPIELIAKLQERIRLQA